MIGGRHQPRSCITIKGEKGLTGHRERLSGYEPTLRSLAVQLADVFGASILAMHTCPPPRLKIVFSPASAHRLAR